MNAPSPRRPSPLSPFPLSPSPMSPSLPSPSAGPLRRIGAILGPGDLGLEPTAIRAMEEVWSEAVLPDEVRRCLGTLDAKTVEASPAMLGEPVLAHGLLFGVTAGAGATHGPTDGPEGSEAVVPRFALTVAPQGEAPAGLRVEAIFRDAIQRLARDEPTNAVERIQHVAGALLPPWTEGLEHLGALRWGLLARTAVALDHATRIGAPTAVLLIHEIMSLSRTREARRRNNREDLDRYVRRLSGGTLPRLQRGILSGPIAVGDVTLYVGKVRRDLQ